MSLFTKALGWVRDAAKFLGAINDLRRQLPADPKLPSFDDTTEPIPLTWRDVDQQRSQAARSVAADKANQTAGAVKPPSSRYD